jgi:hypothetical protein
MQKRSRTLDSYELKEKIRKIDYQRLKQVTQCNLGYGKTKNPNFFEAFSR